MIESQTKIVTVGSSSQVGNDPFLLDFEKLLRRQSQENMSPYLYSTPDPNLDKDLACGELYYNELIYNVPTYYLYRDEVKILQNSAKQLASYLPKEVTILEFGVGTEIAFRNKTLPFLKAIPDLALYVPIDLCVNYLIQAQEILAQELPEVNFNGIETDFVKNVSIVQDFVNPVVFFKGSTITNMPPEQCIEFFSCLSDALPSGGLLIVGQDSNASEISLHQAYVHQIVEDFVLSIFYRFKRDYPTQNFMPNAFKYQFNWLPNIYCVKHTAVATQAQTFNLKGNLIEIQTNDEFHIVSSYKYPVEFFQDMAKQGGFQSISVLSEPSNPMVIHVLQKN